MKYDYIPCDPKLKNLSRSLRQNVTKPERVLWDECLKEGQAGYRFLRQKPLDQFIADFYCSELLLVIEVDGESHDYQIEEDEIRTERLNNLKSVKKLLFEKFSARHKEILGK